MVASLRATQDSIRALMLIRAYRVRGHLAANLDPLGLSERPFTENSCRKPMGLRKPTTTGRSSLTTCSVSRRRRSGRSSGSCGGPTASTSALSSCTSRPSSRRPGFRSASRARRRTLPSRRKARQAILNKLIEAEAFEKFSDVKYTGTKRFGLDGGESMVPALEQIIKRGGQLGVQEIVFGMAAPRPAQRARQRDGQAASAPSSTNSRAAPFKPDDVEGSGDVKYHLGASSDREFDGNQVHLSLTANPSHLEIVDPVVLGKVRAKQDQLGDTRAKRSPAAAAPRRCGVRRPGRRCRVLRAVRPARATAPAARSISSSTIRSASRRTRASRAPRPTPPTSPR